MDVVLSAADHYVLTPYLYPASWPEDSILRQFLSLNLLTDLGGLILYLLTASLNYWLVFDHKLLTHPLILENQVEKEIRYTLKAIPWMGLLTSATFLAEVRGYSCLYDNVHDSKYGWWMIVTSVITFLMFTDCLIYWIHRGLHHKAVYKYLHKDHHRWKVPTPFASHAFHPLDGFSQSAPYHIYVFLFPMHKFTYLMLYVFVNVWTVSIHDGDFRVPRPLQPLINGSAHHTDHHVYYNYNYGQYFTLWDRLGGSFRYPSSFQGKGPMDDVLKKQRVYGSNKNQATIQNGTPTGMTNGLANGSANGDVANGHANGAVANGNANGAAINGHAKGMVANGNVKTTELNGHANGSVANGKLKSQ